MNLKLKKLVITMSAGLSVGTVTLPATADGMFDFLDPCIGAQRDFRKVSTNASVQLHTRVVNALRENAAATATPEFREYWTNQKRSVLSKYFDESIFPAVKKLLPSKTDSNAVFEQWLSQVKRQPATLQAIDTEYRRLRQLAILDQKQSTVRQLDENQRELDKACPADFGNQFLRGTLNIAMTPINVIAGNVEGAKRESGELPKLLRFTTGISLKDIREHGLLGGPGSFFRKNLGLRW